MSSSASRIGQQGLIWISLVLISGCTSQNQGKFNTSSGPTSDGGSLIASDPSGTQAAQAQKLLNGFGVNTHIDFANYGYENLSQTIDDINYVGNGMLKILRDSPGNDSDLTSWLQVFQGTGARFDAYIGEGAPSIYQDELDRMIQMKQAGTYIMGFEGGNEEDDSYPVGLGNDEYQAASFQQQVWAAGQQYGVPVFNISFGAGWTATNNWQGDYDKVGDLSSITTYGNAHTYPVACPNCHSGDFARLNSLAKIAASTPPVAITEFGWTSSDQNAAAYTVEGILDAFLLGNPYYFYYALYDDGSGTFGLFSGSGQPKQAADAVRTLFELLGDPGENATTFTPGKLDYSLSGMPAGSVGSVGGQQLLLQKSDGSFWLALWNEQSDSTQSPTDVTLNLAATATSISVYDVLSGSTSPVQTASETRSIVLSVPAYPVLVKIIKPSTSGTVTPNPSPDPTASASPSPSPTPSPSATSTPASLVSGSDVTLMSINTDQYVYLSGSNVMVDAGTASSSAAFGFTDQTSATAPYNADSVLLQGSNGNYLVYSATDGSVTASATTASSATVFTILKVSDSTSSSGMGIFSGDTVYLQTPDGHQCGPDGSSKFVCVGTWPDSSEFFRIQAQ